MEAVRKCVCAAKVERSPENHEIDATPCPVVTWIVVGRRERCERELKAKKKAGMPHSRLRDGLVLSTPASPTSPNYWFDMFR